MAALLFVFSKNECMGNDSDAESTSHVSTKEPTSTVLALGHFCPFAVMYENAKKPSLAIPDDRQLLSTSAPADMYARRRSDTAQSQPSQVCTLGAIHSCSANHGILSGAWENMFRVFMLVHQGDHGLFLVSAPVFYMNRANTHPVVCFPRVVFRMEQTVRD
jgi:hypothetical protein